MASKRRSLSARQQEEIFGILLMMLGLLILISLISVDPNEEPAAVGLSRLSGNAVHNAMGIAGVYIAYLLITVLLGYPAIVVPFLLIAWGWNRFRGQPTEKLRRYTIYGLSIALYVATVLAMPDLLSPGGAGVGFTLSGLLAGFLATQLTRLVGVAGSVVVLVAIAMIAAIVVTQLSLAQWVATLGARVATGRAWLTRRWHLLRLKVQTQRKLGRHHYRTPVLSGTREAPAAAASSSLSQDTSVDGTLVPHSVLRDSSVDVPAWKRWPTALRRPIRARPGQEDTLSEKDATASAADIGLAAPRWAAGAEATSDGEEAYGVMEERIGVEGGPGPGQGTLRPYEFPPIELLEPHHGGPDRSQTRDELLANAKILEERLADFDVQGRVVEINPGPVITRYEYEPAAGVKVSRITSLADDLALAMRAERIRIVAPIPGKAAVGVELPNREPEIVSLRSIIDSAKFRESASPMTLALGKTIAGHAYVTTLDRMPHLLIAGSTGSGKSVCLNTIIASILYKAHPSDLQFVMVDPKRLELSAYKRLRHYHLTYRDDLNEEVVTTAQNALAVLKSLEWEMEKRYSLLAHAGTRNIDEYNRRLAEGQGKLAPTAEPARAIRTRPLAGQAGPGTQGTSTDVSSDSEQPSSGVAHERLPYIVLIIDELADLMLIAAKEVEEPIARLTQMSRAVGIHLIVATQRPSVDVITGVIKANFPARIAFQVASKVDSRTILDMNGAEKLLGRGDMLFLPPASPEPVRLHNAFISSEESERLIDHVCRQPRYPKKTLPIRTGASADGGGGVAAGRERDELFNEALKLVVRHQQGSISLLQRRLKIGYSRAARLIDELEAGGFVGVFDGSKARDVLINEEQLEELGIQ